MTPAELASKEFGEWALQHVPGLRERLESPPVRGLRLTKSDFLQKYHLPE